jgi:ribonuclease III
MDFTKYKVFAAQTLGVQFVDLQLLITAFTHRSYINEHKKSASEHNERLEFLGDAVLELVVTEYLYLNHPDPEGILTSWRSSLVRTESIAAAAARCQFFDLIRMSKGEKKGSIRAHEQILANTFEAVIGAIYLDKGYDSAKDFITANILSTFEQILATGSWMDAKSKFQEVAQSKFGSTPVYKVLSEAGPDHDKIFRIGVYVASDLLGEGSGPSKQIAQQKSAEVALAALEA